MNAIKKYLALTGGVMLLAYVVATGASFVISSIMEKAAEPFALVNRR